MVAEGRKESLTQLLTHSPVVYLVKKNMRGSRTLETLEEAMGLELEGPRKRLEKEVGRASVADQGM